MPKQLSTNNYKVLVTKIAREFSAFEFVLKNKAADTYWKVGRWIYQHLLENKNRAGYGTALYERLAKDVNRDKSTLLRATQFYRAYPILAERRQLNWNHYKSLITVQDNTERKKLEEKIISHDWDALKLQNYLSFKRELKSKGNDDKPIPQLIFTRGRIHIYRIAQANHQLAQQRPLALDFGFRLQYALPGGFRGFQESDIVALTLKEGTLTRVEKVEASPDELFTYQAQVDQVIDGDTLLTSFDFHGSFSLSQKLRLRGIDCPELDTDEGRKAKRFVETRLKNCDFVIVKTYKDRADKFDRYLADIFYLPQANDPQVVAREGIYLNQELLNEHLAVEYKSRDSHFILKKRNKVTVTTFSKGGGYV